MPTIILTTRIYAPRDRSFDLARDIDAHCRSTGRTRERAVAGRTHGLIELGESVTFEAVHFGIRQRLTGRIVEMERPHYFVDEMQQGIFRSFRHRHDFREHRGVTVMRDCRQWESPLGPLGRFADALFLKRYMRRFLRARNRELKRMAELNNGAEQ